MPKNKCLYRKISVIIRLLSDDNFRFRSEKSMPHRRRSGSASSATAYNILHGGQMFIRHIPTTRNGSAAGCQSTITSPSRFACTSHGERHVTRRGLSCVSTAGAPHAKPSTAGSQKSQNITAVNDSRNRLQQHHLTFTVLINPDATAPPGR